MPAEAAALLERHVVDGSDKLYAFRVVTGAGTVGRFIFEGDAKQCAALPDLLAAADEAAFAFAELAGEIVDAANTDTRWERLANAFVVLDASIKKARGK